MKLLQLLYAAYTVENYLFYLNSATIFFEGANRHKNIVTPSFQAQAAAQLPRHVYRRFCMNVLCAAAPGAAQTKQPW